MKIDISIIMDEHGVKCSATTCNGRDAYLDSELNTIAIGAIEIAKASLLARRWGLNIGNSSPSPPLVGTTENNSTQE